MNQVELNAFDLSPMAVRAHVARGRAERSRIIRGFGYRLFRGVFGWLGRATARRRPRLDVGAARMAGMNA